MTGHFNGPEKGIVIDEHAQPGRSDSKNGCNLYLEGRAITDCKRALPNTARGRDAGLQMVQEGVN